MKAKKIVAIIPARMASTRFPGKPLAPILGLPMVEHVRRRVSLCDMLSRVVVATCDDEIKNSIEGYRGEAIMTSDKHERCTDRVAEVAKHLEADIIVNVQGDEPLIMPEMIKELIRPLIEDDRCKCTNLISPITNEEEFKNPNAVKTVLDISNNILYFSREPIPSGRKTKNKYARYKQLGIVAFKKNFLILYSSMKQTPIEKIESIDMMRLLENGYPIKAVLTDRPLYGVDTPDELDKVESIMRNDSLVEKYMR